MSPAHVVQIARDLMYTAILLALPTLAVSLLVGLVIGLFQAMTSIQEQTLSFVPRMLAVALVLVFTLPWALQLATHFTARMLWQAAEVGR